MGCVVSGMEAFREETQRFSPLDFLNAPMTKKLQTL